jgi:hypothetical protein
VKLHKEHKIAIGFVALAAAAYFGYNGYAAYTIDRVTFAPIKPGRVNIVGIDTSKGYRIIVANQVAQLVQGGVDEFGAPDFSETDSNSNQKRRVPLREMLQVLQGDEVALGKFITGMSDQLRGVEMPTQEIYWTTEDVQKALDGDVALRTKLESDLNMRLDGTPLDQIRMRSIQNGIVLKCRIPVDVPVEGEVRKLVGEVLIPYRPRFVEDLEKRYEQQFDLTAEKVKGYYLELADELAANPSTAEDIARSLRTRIEPEALKARYTPKPLTDLLSTARVLLNDSFIEKASFSEQPGPEGKPVYDVQLDVTDEGRQRLWQFSRKQKGTQLLLVVDGIAIAAPRVRGEITQPQVTIKQIPDRGLVEDAVELINSLRKN